PPPEIARPPRAGRGLLAVRVLRPPVQLEVVESSEGAGGGRPASVRSGRDATLEIAGSVRVAAGPWSMEGGVWSGAPAARDYWDVELAEGGLYRLYRDRASRAWFADGVYD